MLKIKLLKVGDYIYTDSENWSICWHFTTNSKRYLIGEIVNLFNEIDGNPKCRIEWKNTLELFKKSLEDTSLIKKYFKVISEAKALALLM